MVVGYHHFRKPPYTPPKFNIVLEKWWLEDHFLGFRTFQGRTVKLWEGFELILSIINGINYQH